MLKLVVASVKMLYRDKQALFWALAFPVIFVAVFGLFDLESGPEVRIALVGEPGNPIAGALRSGLEDVEGFDLSSSRDLESARDRLAEDELEIVVWASDPSARSAPPPRPGPNQPTRATGLGGTVKVFYDRGNVEENQPALAAIGQIVDRMNLRMAGVRTPPIAIERRAVAAKEISFYDFLLPGFVAMGVMNASIIGMAVAIAQFRQQRILKRILATPLRPMRFLIAQVVARLLLSLVQTGLILAVGMYVFGGRVYGNIVWLFVLAAFANLIFLNLGFAVAGRSPNPDAAQGLANAVALPMMFLSGVFFPVDTLPEIMQTVVRFLPLTPLIEAMRAVALDGESITATGPQLVQLAVWVVVSFLIAKAMFNFAKA